MPVVPVTLMRRKDISFDSEIACLWLVDRSYDLAKKKTRCCMYSLSEISMILISFSKLILIYKKLPLG